MSKRRIARIVASVLLMLGAFVPIAISAPGAAAAPAAQPRVAGCISISYTPYYVTSDDSFHHNGQIDCGQIMKFIDLHVKVFKTGSGGGVVSDLDWTCPSCNTILRPTVVGCFGSHATKSYYAITKGFYYVTNNSPKVLVPPHTSSTVPLPCNTPVV